MPPMEKLDAELLLELLDLAAHRRLGEEKLLPGLGEGKVPRRGLESLQEIQARDAVPGGHSHSFCSCVG